MPHTNGTQEESSQPAQTSSRPSWDPKYEAVAEAWRDLDADDALLLSGLAKDDINRLRRLFYERFGKINVLVRSVQQDDGTYKAVIRERDGREYLWGDDD